MLLQWTTNGQLDHIGEKKNWELYLNYKILANLNRWKDKES